MTREEARKAAEVMLAYANGKEIECAKKNDNDWKKVNNPSFLNWDILDYRIKPKPKFDPETLQPFDKVLVKDRIEQVWACDFFSQIDYKYEYPYICVTGGFDFVIPYNEDTKHLVGTKDEAPEFYRYWED